MDTSNAYQNEGSDTSEWQFLAEYPLSEFLPDYEITGGRTAGMLLQTMREVGMPQALCEYMGMTLAGFVKEALAYLKPGSLELPGRICVFCQKKLISEANFAKTPSNDNAETMMEQAQVDYPSGSKTNGGWGYYVIEKGRDISCVSCKETGRTVELYIYKEGK